MMQVRKLWRVGREDGYTMTEMIVVVMILGIVLAAVQTTLVMTNKSVGQSGQRINQTLQAKTAIDSVTKVLRTAVLPSQLNGTGSTSTAAAFIQGTKNSVQFYANINNDANVTGPSQVTYAVGSDGVLSETIQPPNAHAANDYNYQYCTPSASCVVKSRVLARGVSTTVTMFTYYTKAGTAIPDATLTAAELASVDSIDVVITVKAAASQTVGSTTLTERVTLPNADSVAQPTSSP